MTSLKAGQKALSLSANVIMASTIFIKDTGCTGILRLVLLGILLPSVLVSGQDSPMPATEAPSTTESATTSMNSTAATQTPTFTPISESSVNSTNLGSTITTTTNSSSGFTSLYPFGGTSGMNGTAMSNLTSMTMIYCPSFMCNYSDCYTMYTGQNATACAAGAFCQLMRQKDMFYTVSCSDSCAYSCFNTSQTNCSVMCCNSTDCLNGSFASMMRTTTTEIATTTKTTTIMTTPVPATTTPSPQTTANNGNKCHSGVCTGTDCYTGFKSAALQTCSFSQPHCQLKKETVDSMLQWTAGCTINCLLQTPCKASTLPPCHLECCVSVPNSCLWLNGTLNVPSFATRGPHLSAELIACLLALLAITLLL